MQRSIFGDAEVMRHGFGIQTHEWVTTWLQKCLQNYDQLQFGLWAVVEKNSGLVIGYCGLTLFPDIEGKPETEIGYRLARRTWGNGYATEAAHAVRDYAWKNIGIRRLVAIIDPSNSSSIRVAEKLGMHYEKDVMLPGYTYPDRLYVIQR